MNTKVSIAVAVFLCLALSASGGHADVKGLFPTMDGWDPEGDPEVYTAKNLFEYIDGSADLYLTYAFVEMATVSYFDDQGRGLTVEIFDHGDDANSFGIYSQERPDPMDEIEVGGQGYYEFGILNFCQGPYYVKIVGYDLEDFDEDMLSVVAKIISANIGGKKALPAALACFPSESKVANSERYLSENVLGHAFLHSAFVAQYRAGGATTRAFIIQAEDAEDADGMLESYLAFVEEQGGAVADEGGVYRFEDPRLRSGGAISLKKSGRYIWAMPTGNETAGAAYIAGVEQNLKAAGLID